MAYQTLTQDQIDHFINHGYTIVHDAIPTEIAERWVERGFERIGYDRDDPSTWEKSHHHLPVEERLNVTEHLPRLWGAMCDLVGGSQRVEGDYELVDALIFNLGEGADQPWQPPAEKQGGWHKDGDFFKHFLDSPEQGLLPIACWTDMIHQGGATFIAPDSVDRIAQRLAEHPEGLYPNGFGGIIDQCHEFVELTANQGDVVLHHPFMLHTRSRNPRLHPRAITNGPLVLKEPMQFNRSNVADHSPLERAVLRALGVERYDFQPTAAREQFIPKRLKKQQQAAAGNP